MGTVTILALPGCANTVTNNPLNDQFGLTGPIQVNAGQEKQNLGTVILVMSGG